MTQIVVSEQTLLDLRGCSGRTALVDPSGAVIGYFEPAASNDRGLYAKARALFSEDELARRRQEPAIKTSADVWREITQPERAQ